MPSVLLTSFPSLGPQDAHDLYTPTLNTTSALPPSPESRPSHHQQNAHSHPHAQQSAASARQPAGVPHAHSHSVLRADENAIATRKANIRRFGAGWLRPPGIGKTLQGLEDERLEREEQEAAAMREQALLEEQAAAEAELAAAQRQQAGEPTGEQDLDADIPDASSALDDTEALTPGDDDEGEWVDEAEGGLPPAEDEGDGDYALPPQGEHNGADGVMAMTTDLDDDIPDAGSYQHTDTDVEDSSSSSSSGEDEGDSRIGGGGRAGGRMSAGGRVSTGGAMSAGAMGTGDLYVGPAPTAASSADQRAAAWNEQLLPPSMAAARQSFGGGGLGSSVFGSSPVMEARRRTQQRGGGRRSGGGV